MGDPNWPIDHNTRVNSFTFLNKMASHNVVKRNKKGEREQKKEKESKKRRKREREKGRVRKRERKKERKKIEKPIQILEIFYMPLNRASPIKVVLRRNLGERKKKNTHSGKIHIGFGWYYELHRTLREMCIRYC